MSKKKNIYSLNIKEMRKLIADFSKTLYGRTVFFLAYFTSLLALITLVGLFIVEMISPSDALFYAITGTFFLFIGLFTLGNVYYYHEIRVFDERRSGED